MARPRTVSLSKEEMIALGKEMIEWIKLNPDILHLSQWYTIHKMFTYNQWKAMIQCEEFLPYYEQALKLVGIKYLDKSSNVRDGISQRWQRSYFPDLKEREDQEADEDAARKKNIEDSKMVSPKSETLHKDQRIAFLEEENRILKLNAEQPKAEPELLTGDPQI